MRLREIVLAATCLPIALPAHGQAMIPLSTDSGPKTPVPVDPPADPRDTPESIAKDAARDLKDARFYNKPGATRAQYDADWQQCRLIARGSRSPSGSVPYYYNPAVVSPLAAGIGAGIGGAIAAAIAEGVQRRENRRNCLLIRGWRLVEVDSANSARVAAMTDVQRSAYLDTMVGAPTVAGKITERSTFTMKGEASLHLDAPVQDPGVLFLGKKIGRCRSPSTRGKPRWCSPTCGRPRIAPTVLS